MVVKRGKPALYDLGTDIHEDHDLSAIYPGILKRLIRIVHEEHQESPVFSVTLPKKM